MHLVCLNLAAAMLQIRQLLPILLFELLPDPSFVVLHFLLCGCSTVHVKIPQSILFLALYCPSHIQSLLKLQEGLFLSLPHVVRQTFGSKSPTSFDYI